MDPDEKSRRATSFGAVAEEYAAWRPGYPDDAVHWLAGDRPTRILELGCGTGKLTTGLVDAGHDVIAADITTDLLDQVGQAAPAAARLLAGAEDIPLADQSVDLVVAAQAYHWFDIARAEPEIARVLRPAGSVALVWNRPDTTVPWVRKLFAFVTTATNDDATDPWTTSAVFALAGSKQVRHWQQLKRDGIEGLMRSQSMVATASPERRTEILDAADALYDDYARGPAGLTIPWVAHCYRGRLLPGVVVAEPTVASDPADRPPATSRNSQDDSGFQISWS